MTRIHGQIESLKRIRHTLDKEGISRFNSTGDINCFLQNYDNQKEELFFTTERNYDLELEALQSKATQLGTEHSVLKNNVENQLNNRISRFNDRCTILSRPAKNAIIELLNWYQLQFYKGVRFCLEKSANYLIHQRTKNNKLQLDRALKKVNSFSINRQKIISERFASSFKELEHIKNVCDGLYPLIAGAIGENLVATELENLSDDCVLINDFSLNLERPIYYKKENTRIYSIQIDHLLVTKAGVFIIETKNWSRDSIDRYDLRSPVKQIHRTNYALFVLLNSMSSNVHRTLQEHHWGDQRLPIRNIVAMVNHKPKAKFKHVAIKKLNELNDYIEYFEPLFNSKEVCNIADLLISWNK